MERTITIKYGELAIDKKLIVCRIIQEVFVHQESGYCIRIVEYNFNEGIRLILDVDKKKSKRYIRFLLRKRKELDALLGIKVKIVIDYDKKPIDRIDLINSEVCKYFNIPIEVFHSVTRKREIVQARQLSMFFSLYYTKSSLSEIGKKIGDKDHATVMHAEKTINNLIETDKRFKLQADEIELRLKKAIAF